MVVELVYMVLIIVTVNRIFIFSSAYDLFEQLKKEIIIVE